MKIQLIEARLEDIKDSNIVSIVELIVEAVRDFPVIDMDDTELYFSEIKRLINSDTITSNSIANYLKTSNTERTEKTVWINSSLHALLHALDLMDLHKITFDKIKNTVGI